MRITLFVFLILFFAKVYSQSENNSVSLLFIGDIMGHDAQIESAYDSALGTYLYEDVFDPIESLIQAADFSVANLEVTLAGKPHKGYPQFSSPDELAQALKNSGIDVLITANNHSCDRGKDGIIRTADVLDFLEIKHTGTFRDKVDKDSMNLLILEKNDIRVGVLNYTYGTNGLPFPKPTLVNLIDKDSILSDLNHAKAQNLDKIIVTVHWGSEYQTLANEEQKDIAEFLFENGADIIIGSHPHVIQPMVYQKGTKKVAERLITYSLGNFISNQREPRTDGGAMVEFELVKENGSTRIRNQGYYLTWVNKYEIGTKYKYEILPCDTENINISNNLDKEGMAKMKEFIKDSKERLNAENINFPELTYSK